uniref:Uncharacterized protein n=1 Tax=Avena sativa TaxID=4498 RepID=A0ACD5ZFV1_AVESA
MLPGKTTPPAGAAFLLAANKPASPSIVSAKQAQDGAGGGVVLAVDGSKRAMAALAGRGAFSDSDDLNPKEFSADLIKKVAEEASSQLRMLRAPKEIPFPAQAAFSKEVEALQKMCESIAEGSSGFDEDGAVTIVMGLQARIKLLLKTDKKESPQDFLLSTKAQIKASVEEYISAQDAQPTNPMASSDAERKTLYEIVDKSSLVRPTPTVCTKEEVKTVLQKTLALLQSEPVNSTRGMAGLFDKVRSNCQALLDDVEKNGVNDKTGVAIVLIHFMAIGVLGQQKKHFNYDDAADDTLLSSLQRLEVALRDYKLGGPAGEDTDTD